MSPRGDDSDSGSPAIKDAFVAPGPSDPWWTGSLCMKGSLLTDRRLRSKCERGEIADVFCRNIRAGELCGQYAEGTFREGRQWQSGQPRSFHPPLCDWPHFQALSRSVSTVALLISDQGEPRRRDAACSYWPNLDPQQLLRALRRNDAGPPSTILWTGDSMIRQLFLRAIAMLRGDANPADHYFHTDAMYVLWPTRDALMPIETSALRSNRSLAAMVSRYFPGFAPSQGQAVSEVTEDAPLLVMLFLWDPKPAEYRREPFAMHRVTTQISAFMYWWQMKSPITDIDPYLTRLPSLLDARSKATAGSSLYFFVTTPWTAPKTFGGVDDAVRIPRNQHVLDRLAQLGRRDVGIIDFSSLADAAGRNRFPKTRDGIHYMCIWTPKFPEPINHQKVTANNCTDPMNAAVVRWLATAVAGQRIGR